MKKFVNGVAVDMTPEEIAEAQAIDAAETTPLSDAQITDMAQTMAVSLVDNDSSPAKALYLTLIDVIQIADTTLNPTTAKAAVDALVRKNFETVIRESRLSNNRIAASTTNE